MKCLKCGNSALYRERGSGQCPRCRQFFAFEPKRGDPFTDTFFQAAIKRMTHHASAYHPRQLYFELARRKRAKLLQHPLTLQKLIAITLPMGAICNVFCWLLFVQAIGLSFWLVEPMYLGLVLLIARGSWKRSRAPVPAVSYEAFTRALQRWKKIYPDTLGSLMPPANTRPSTPLPPQQLQAYALERVVICDKPEMVDFLLANQFHLEQKCAVLCFNGYPHDSFEAICALLRRSPRLMVYLIHNASFNGCRILPELRQPQWFPGAQIFDIGLSPRQAQAFRGLWEPATGHPPPVSGFSPEDQDWLTQWKLDLMALPPGRLLNHLRNQINRHQQQVVDAYAAGDSDGGAEMSVFGDFSLDFDDGGGDDFG